MNYKIAQFILTPGQRGESTHEIFVAQPDANKEALAGKLFALIEIESKRADNLKIINFLINTLNHNYYQNEKMILRERVASIKIEHIFESALAKTNKKLAEFLQSEKIKLNPDTANITIGVISGDSLHFSSLGKNKGFLLYKNKTDDGAAAYKLADITENSRSKESKKPSSAAKLFSDVTSGSLPRGGYFVFANETFSEYLSAKQIIGIVTTLPPASAAEQIKNTLGKINAYVPFLGIIIKNTAGTEMREVKTVSPAASTKASIENLITTEENTEKLLTPSGLISPKKLASFFNGLAGAAPLIQGGKAGGRPFMIKDKIFSGKKAAWFSPGKIFNFLKTVFVYLAGLLVFIFKILTDKKNLLEFLNNLGSSAKNLVFNIKTASLKAFFWYKNLNRTNKILFSAFLICLALFAFVLSWQSVKNNGALKQAAVGALASAIEQKQNQIDASLLYNNEEGAKKFLDEVGPLLAQLPRKTQEQKDLYNELATKNRVQLEKISRVIRVEPSELADLANLNAAAKPSNILLALGKIFAADAARKSIYSIDPASKLTSAISLFDKNIGRLDFPGLDRNNNINYFNTNDIVILDAKNEKLSASLAIDFTVNPRKIVDLKQYNGRYYMADAQNGQIYRFSKNGEKLSGGAAWLNSKDDLSGAVSMDIDGSVYILKGNGEVLKYTKGEKNQFSLSLIEPAFSRAEKISVSREQNYLYVLEPAGKRLVVFNKSGKFINQYTSDKFNDLKDFQVDEKNKKIYLLNDSLIYSIDINLPAK